MRLVWRTIFRVVGRIILCLGCVFPFRAADRPESVPGRLLAGYRGDPASPALAQTLLLHRAVVRRHVDQLGLHVLEVPETASEAIAASLRQTGLFDYVERDYYAHTGSDPNDPSYIAQWHLPRHRR